MTEEKQALESRIQDLESAIATLRDHHKDDIATIGTTLIAEAKSRDLVDEYDELVNNLELHFPLPKLRRRYNVHVNAIITVESDDEDVALDKINTALHTVADDVHYELTPYGILA